MNGDMNGDMNGNMSWMYYTEVNFPTRKIDRELCLESFFLVETAVKFRSLQISKILNTDTNRIFPVPFKVMYTSLSYTSF